MGVLKTLWGVIRNLQVELKAPGEALKYQWGAQRGSGGVCQVPARLLWWLSLGGPHVRGLSLWGILMEVFGLCHAGGSNSRAPVFQNARCGGQAKISCIP